MASDWTNTTLGKVILLKRGYDLPTRLRTPGPFPVVSSSGISGSHEEAKVKGPGVVTGRYGTLGLVHYVEDDFWPLNTTLYVRDFKGNDRRFISYFLKTIDYLAYSDKAAVPGVNRNHLHLAPVSIPPPPEQRAIAHVLGTLDDKIELSRRMNDALEAAARAIFKSWFVDFDPVRAKSEGRPVPGLNEETASVFPAALEPSASGAIPTGWTIGCLRDVATNPRRGVKPEEIEPGAPYIALQHMPRGSIALSEWQTADEIASGKFRFNRGEILFGKLRPYFHKVGVPAVDGVCSTDILVIVPTAPAWFGFVLMHASSAALIAHTTACSTGTKMPRTNWRDIGGFEVVVPTEQVAAAFTDQIAPLVERIHANIHESRTLTTMRDALLPQLLSGQIRIEDAEKFLEART